jgi:periplasmic copper chaperone A
MRCAGPVCHIRVRLGTRSFTDEDVMTRAYVAALAALSTLISPAAIPSPAAAAPGAGPSAPSQDARLVRRAASATPADYTLGALRIKAPWMRATPKGATVAGGYLSITNTGSDPDRLMSIESDAAATVEVHEMSMSGGVMTMRPVGDPLTIAPSQTLELKPGGYHVMFTRLKQGVSEGDKVKATLVFEKGGRIEIEFLAGAIGASGPGQMMMMPSHKM